MDEKTTHTACLEVRCDVRTLANLLRVLDHFQVKYSSKSDFLRACLELLEQIMLEKVNLPEQTTTEAYTYFMGRFGTTPNRSGRSFKNLLQALQMEALEADKLDPNYATTRTTKLLDLVRYDEGGEE